MRPILRWIGVLFRTGQVKEHLRFPEFKPLCFISPFKRKSKNWTQWSLSSIYMSASPVLGPYFSLVTRRITKRKSKDRKSRKIYGRLQQGDRNKPKD